MGDLTGKYFARVAFVKAVKWLSRFDRNIPLPVREYSAKQAKEAAKIRGKIEELHSTTDL